jgi:hypothetical protein
VAEKSEYSEEAELKDEMPDVCKKYKKEENECAQITVIIVGRHPMAKTGIVTRALWRVESWELVSNDSFFFLELGHHTYWSRKLTRVLACGDSDRQ